MPRTSHRIQRFLFRLFFLSLAGYVLGALRRDGSVRDERVEPVREPDFVRPEVTGRTKLEHWEDGRMSPSRRRTTLALTFSAIFFAGASLTAGAGDQAARMLEHATKAPEATAEATAEA
nr:hypothetical protein [Actinomycetota bacterium]